MNMNDMIVISTDDHICEPGDMFDNHLSGEALATAPKLKTDKDGKNYWSYQGRNQPGIGLNAVVGRPLEEYGMEPNSIEQLRKGTYDVHARIDDMNVDGVAVQMNFGNSIGFDNRTFHQAPDKDLALIHLRAWNDWLIDEWCGAYPGRFIPCAILPTWDPKEMVAEIKRVEAKGCTTISISENPTKQGLPSIHNEYWDPFFRTISELDMTTATHIGSGNPQPHASEETPIDAWITTMPLSIAVGAADWLQLQALHKYPNLRIALAESSIGWIPYFRERADFSTWRHKAWTHSVFQDVKPSEIFNRHFLCCFIDDPFGLKHLEDVGEDIVAFETDYPHSDSVWPYAAEHLWEQVKHLTDAQINKVTHENAMRFFRFDPFKHHKREELTVAALRAQAEAKGVDTTLISSGGSAPVEPGTERPITSGDLMTMFHKHAATIAETEASA